jgi:hypothetical protein
MVSDDLNAERAQISVDLDVERAKAEATQKGYLDKMEAHTAHTKLSLDLEKMLVEKKIELNGRERNLGLCEAVLAEAQSQGLNPRDDHEELMEFIELWKLLHYGKVERIAKAG